MNETNEIFKTDNLLSADEETMKKINEYSVKKLSPEEVFCFSVILCDNDIDRDGEKFSLDSLYQLSSLFKGKTGIFDHDPKGENQTARIFDTHVKKYPDKFTADNEVYCALVAGAYMIRTEKNKDLVAEINGGIKKEVSVSCQIKNTVCSICGSDRKSSPCMHKKGNYYGEKLCFDILENPCDAFEWSFVAVPAQRNAGVIKKFDMGKPFLPNVQNNSKLKKAEENLRGDILKLSYFTKPFRTSKSVLALTENMPLEELIKLKEILQEEINRNPSENLSFITAETTDDDEDNSSFKI